ncbi:MAG TPA: PAS domain-containing protein [Xanthobacteraceae bacterium]|nr:PAS domain-containing protein [Xanthobacteraceae bacterium]
MKHRSSQILFDHWTEKRAGRLLPERSEIDPASIRSALGDTFILAFNPLPENPFRLAGTRICALFGRELKGAAFAALWAEDGSIDITRMVCAVADESVGVVARAVGSSESGDSVDLELLLLPLSHCGQTHLRLIGTLAPLTVPYWLGLSPITRLTLAEYRYVGHHGERSASIVRLPPAESPRRRHGLVVYDGGQV